MRESFTDRLKHAWNAFLSRDPPKEPYSGGYLYGSTYRPDRQRFSLGGDRSIITSIYNRISMDCASVSIKHVRLDANDRYSETIDSGLNNCISFRANIDQTGRSFIQDAVMTMLEEGSVALVPVETSLDPKITGSYDILSMRVGKIIEWFPEHVKLNVYNEKEGQRQDIILPKKIVAIAENPFYSVMNEPNSTLQRLNRKLALLDISDEDATSGKLDLIVQLPYMLKGETKKKAAEDRRTDLQNQLSSSQYGVAYIDSTEHIVQLNRPIENNLLSRVEYYTKRVYSDLGLTETIMDGTADEKTMLNYQSRTIEPIVSALVDAMMCKFLTKTARSQGQAIWYFKDPFKLVPVAQLAELADKFTRNEIMTGNEFRQIVGLKPSDDPGADELRNKNLNNPNAQAMPTKEVLPEEQSVPMEETGETESENIPIDQMPISELMK